MDGEAWWAAVHAVAKSRTWLSDFTFTFHFHVLEKEMATHSSVLAWRIPGTGEPGGLPSMGSHRVGHDWSDLAAEDRRKKKTTTTCDQCISMWKIRGRAGPRGEFKSPVFIPEFCLLILSIVQPAQKQWHYPIMSQTMQHLVNWLLSTKQVERHPKVKKNKEKRFCWKLGYNKS